MQNHILSHILTQVKIQITSTRSIKAAIAVHHICQHRLVQMVETIMRLLGAHILVAMVSPPFKHSLGMVSIISLRLWCLRLTRGFIECWLYISTPSQTNTLSINVQLATVL